MSDLFGLIGAQHRYEQDALHQILQVQQPIRPYQLARAFSILSIVSGTSASALDVNTLPTGYEAAAGQVHFQQSGNVLNVNSQTSNAIVNYQTFNIGQQATVNFNLPDSRSAILNRVMGGEPSQILGRMNSNGQVFITNPSGIIFGQSAQVNVGSLFATNMSISNTDFLAGQYTFKQQEQQVGVVKNAGQILAQNYAVLAAAGQVENSGTIQAKDVHLAVGKQVTLQVDNGIQAEVTVDEAMANSYADAISNSGTISAQRIASMQAQLQQAITEKAINNTGVVEATGFGDDGGLVVLEANSGVVSNAGTITAKASSLDGAAGSVSVSGQNITNAGLIQAETGNGAVNTTKDQIAQQAPDQREGNITLKAKQDIDLQAGSTLSAKAAGTTGDGGNVVVWADGNTNFREGSTITASAGSLGGHGGFIEVSARDTVFFNGTAEAKAPMGTAGTLLIDPTNITISTTGSAGSSTVNFNDTPTNATYNPTSFNSFSNVTLEATNNILVSSPWTLTNVTSGNNLVLRAGNDISVNASLSTAGGNITLAADYGFTGFPSDGVGQIITTAPINSGGGNISLSASSYISISQSISAGIGNVNISLSNGQMNVNGSISGNNILIANSATTGVWNDLQLYRPIVATGNLTITLSNPTQNTGFYIGPVASLSSGGIMSISSAGVMRLAGGTINVANLNTVYTSPGLFLEANAFGQPWASSNLSISNPNGFISVVSAQSGFTNISLGASQMVDVNASLSATNITLSQSSTSNVWHDIRINAPVLATGTLSITSSNPTANNGILLGSSASLSAGSSMTLSSGSVLSVGGIINTANLNTVYTAPRLVLARNVFGQPWASTNLSLTNPNGEISVLTAQSGFTNISLIASRQVSISASLSATNIYLSQSSSSNYWNGIYLTAPVLAANNVSILPANTVGGSHPLNIGAGGSISAGNTVSVSVAQGVNLGGNNITAGTLVNLTANFVTSGSSSLVAPTVSLTGTGSAFGVVATPVSISATSLFLNNTGINGHMFISNSGNVTVGASTLGGGSLSVSSSGNLNVLGTVSTGGGNINLAADNISLGSAISAGTGTVNVSARDRIDAAASLSAGNISLTQTGTTPFWNNGIEVAGTLLATNNVRLSTSGSGFGIRLQSGGSISAGGSTNLIAFDHLSLNGGIVNVPNINSVYTAGQLNITGNIATNPWYSSTLSLSNPNGNIFVSSPITGITNLTLDAFANLQISASLSANNITLNQTNTASFWNNIIIVDAPVVASNNLRLSAAGSTAVVRIASAGSLSAGSSLSLIANNAGQLDLNGGIVNVPDINTVYNASQLNITGNIATNPWYSSTMSLSNPNGSIRFGSTLSGLTSLTASAYDSVIVAAPVSATNITFNQTNLGSLWSNAIDVTSTLSASGNITFSMAGLNGDGVRNLVGGSITAGGNLTVNASNFGLQQQGLISVGGVANLSVASVNFATGTVTANTLSLNVNGGAIGTSTAFMNTAVNTLFVNNPSAGAAAFISNAGNLTVGASTLGTQTLSLRTDGNVDIRGDVSAGVISLSAVGSNRTLSINSNLTATNLISILGSYTSVIQPSSTVSISANTLDFNSAAVYGSAVNRLRTGGSYLYLFFNAGGFFDHSSSVTVDNFGTTTGTFDLITRSGSNGSVRLGRDWNFGAQTLSIATDGTGNVTAPNLVVSDYLRIATQNGNIGASTEAINSYNLNAQLSLTTTGNNLIHVYATQSQSLIGLSTGTAGTISLTGAIGTNLTVAGNISTGSISIFAPGTLTQTASSFSMTANTITLASGTGGIGASTMRINTVATSLSLSAPTNTTAFISNAGSLNLLGTTMQGGINLQNNNVISLAGNISLGGDLSLSTPTSTILMDSVGTARTHSARNITLSGSTVSGAGVRIQNSGTSVLARGGNNATNVFDDNPATTTIPTLAPGSTIVLGAPGTLSIDGDFASSGTIQAWGAGGISINYANGNLDLTNVSLNTTAAALGGGITLTNDTSGAGDNGTTIGITTVALDSIQISQSGAGNHIIGTNPRFTTSTLNISTAGSLSFSLTTANNTLNFNSLTAANATLNGWDAASTPLSFGSISTNAMLISLNASNSPITFNTITANTISMSQNPVFGTGIAASSNFAFNSNVSLTSLYINSRYNTRVDFLGNLTTSGDTYIVGENRISIAGAFSQTSSSAILRLFAGTGLAGTSPDNQWYQTDSPINIGGSMSVAMDATKTIDIRGGGNIHTNSFWNQNFNVGSLNIETRSALTPISIGGDITVASGLNLTVSGGSSRITVNGNISQSGVGTINLSTAGHSVSIAGNVIGNHISIVGDPISIVGSISNSGNLFLAGSSLLSIGGDLTNSATGVGSFVSIATWGDVTLAGNLSIAESAANKTFYQWGTSSNFYSKTFFDSPRSFANFTYYTANQAISIRENLTGNGAIALRSDTAGIQMASGKLLTFDSVLLSGQSLGTNTNSISINANNLFLSSGGNAFIRETNSVSFSPINGNSSVAGTLSMSTGGDLYFTTTLTAGAANFSLGAANAQFSLGSNALISLTSGNLNVTADQFILPSGTSINATGRTVTMNTRSSLQRINLFGAATSDSAGTFDLNASEILRISSDRISIGGFNTTISVIGNIDLTSASFNTLSLGVVGTYNGTGQAITLGNKNLSIYAVTGMSTGSIIGGSGTIDLTTDSGSLLLVNGNISQTIGGRLSLAAMDSGPGGDLSILGNIGGGAFTSLYAGGSISGSGTVSATTVSIVAWGGNIGSSSNYLNVNASTLSSDNTYIVPLVNHTYISNNGAVTLTGTNSARGGFNLRNNSDITFASNVTAAAGSISISTSGTGSAIAVSDGVSLSASGNITLTSDRLTLSGTTGNRLVGSSILITPNANQTISIAGSGLDGASTLAVDGTELARISASTVTIGDITKSGGLVLAGAIDLTSRYTLNLSNAGDITRNGTFSSTLGSNAFNIATTGTLSLGTQAVANTPWQFTSVSANSLAMRNMWDSSPISFNWLSVAGNINGLFTDGNNSPVSIGTLAVMPAYTNILVQGANSGVTITNLPTSGTPNFVGIQTTATNSPVILSSNLSITPTSEVALVARQSSISVAGNLILPSSSASITIIAGHSGTTWNNNTSGITVDGTFSIGNNTSRNVEIRAANGSFLTNTYFTNALSFNNLTFAQNSSNNLTIGNSWTAAGTLSLSSGGTTGGIIAASGATLVAPTISLLANGGGIGTAGTSVLISRVGGAAVNLSTTGTSDAYISTGNALTVNASSIGGLLNIEGSSGSHITLAGTVGAGNATIITKGAGNIVQSGTNTLTATSVNFESGTGNIGAGSAIRLAASTLTAISGGASNVSITNAGNVTINSASAGANLSIGGTSNSDLSLNGNINAGTLAQLVTSGTGGMIQSNSGTSISATTVSLSAAGGNIGMSSGRIRTSATTLQASNTGTGNIYLNQLSSGSLNGITAGSGTIEIFSSGTGNNLTMAGNVSTTGRSNILLTGTGSLIQSSGTLFGSTMSLSTGSGDFGASGARINVSGGTLSAIGSLTTSNMFFQGRSNITLGNIDTNTLNYFTAASSGFGVAVQGKVDPTLISISVDTAITDAGGSLLANTISLISGTSNIGASGANRITIDGDIVTATASSGNIYLEDKSTDFTASGTSLAASTANSSTGTFEYVTTNNGALTLAGNVSGSVINLSTNGTGNLVYGSGSIIGTSASLGSGSGNIGATGAGRIQLSVSTVTASTAAGSIYLNMSNSGTLNAISTGSGTGLIDIAATSGTNLSLNGNMTTSLATISLAGTGSLVQTGATSMTATTLSLLAGTGNIGATGAGRINTAVTSLYATTGTGSNVWISQAGALSIIGTTALGGDYNIASNNSIRLLGNTSIGGNLIWSSSAGPINMDNGAGLSVSAENITLSATATIGNGITIANAGTRLTARGAGTASTLNFDDDAGTVGIPTLAAGTAVFAGSAGTISINGDLSNAGTLEAIATSGTININYTTSLLDLTNTTLNAGGSSGPAITLTNDTSGAGNNGNTLDGGVSNTGGVINLTTSGTATASGTGTTLTAATLNLLTSGSGGVSITGVTSNNLSVLGTHSGGLLSLSNTASANTLNIGSLSINSTGGLRLAGAGILNVGNVTLTNASAWFFSAQDLNMTGAFSSTGSGHYINLSGNRINVNHAISIGSGGGLTFWANQAIRVNSNITMSGRPIQFRNTTSGGTLNIGTSGDDNDAGTTIDISQAELGRISNAIRINGVMSFVSDWVNLQNNLDLTAANLSLFRGLDISSLPFGGATGFNANGYTITTGLSQGTDITRFGSVTLGAVTASDASFGNALYVSVPGTITIANSIVATTGPVSLLSSTFDINQNANISTGGQILISTAGNVNQTAGTLSANSLRITTSGTGAIASGGTLQTAVQTLSLSTGSTSNVAFNNTGAMTLSASSIGGALTGVNNTHMTLAGTNTANGMNLSLTGANSTLGIASAATLSSTANVTLTADQVSINPSSSSIAAGLNSVLIRSNAIGQVINLLGSATSDSAGTLDVSQQEFARITAGTLSIGSAANTGGISIIGSADLSASVPSNFVLNTGGNYVGTGQTITLGTKTYTVTAGGFLNSGSLTGGATTIALNSAGTMNINGNVSVTGAGRVNLASTANAGNITIGGNVGGGAITSISGFGTSNIISGAGTVSGTTVSLSSGTGSIGASGSRINTAATSLTIASGAQAFINQNGASTLTGATVTNALDIASNNDVVVSGNATGGTINVSTNGVDSQLTVNNGVSLSTAGNVTLTGDRLTLAGASGNRLVGSSVVIRPNATNKNISIGTGATDSASLLGIDDVELGRISASTVTIGDVTNTSNVGILSDLNIGAGGLNYNLNLSAGGNITGTDRATTLGTNQLNLAAVGNVSIANTSASKPLNFTSISAANITLTTTGTGSGISIGNSINTGNLILAADQTSSNITVMGHVTASGSLTIDSYRSDTSISGNLVSSSSTAPLYLRSGRIWNWANQFSLGGSISIAQGSGKDVSIIINAGTIASSHDITAKSYWNQPLTFRDFSLQGNQNNSPFNVLGDLNTRNLSICLFGTNSSISITGNVLATGDNLILSSYIAPVDISGNLTNQGASGQFFLNNIRSLGGTLSIAENSTTKNLFIFPSTSSNIYSKAYWTGTRYFANVYLYASAGDFNLPNSFVSTAANGTIAITQTSGGTSGIFAVSGVSLSADWVRFYFWSGTNGDVGTALNPISLSTNYLGVGYQVSTRANNAYFQNNRNVSFDNYYTTNVDGILQLANSGNITIPNATTVRAGTFSLQSTITDGQISIGSGSGFSITGTGSSTFTADQININTTSGSIAAGTGSVLLRPNTTGQLIRLAGNATSDAAGTFDLSQQEIGRITAGTLSIGANTNTGGISINGSADLSASGPSNFVLNTGGNYVGTGQTITLGTKTYTVTAGGFLNSGSLTGGATTIALNSAGTMNINGNVSVTGAGRVNLASTTNAGNITIGGVVGGGSITSISAFGTSNMVSGGGTVTATSMTLVTGTGNIGASGARISLSGTSLSVAASTLSSTVFLQGVSDLTFGTVDANIFNYRSGNNVTVAGKVDPTLIDVSVAGNITDAGGSFVANTISLTSGTGNIGASGTDRITIDGDIVSANASSGNVYIEDKATDFTATGTSLTTSGANTSSGTFEYITTNNAALTLAGNVSGSVINLSTNGSGNLEYGSGSIVGTSASLGSGSGNIGATGAGRIQLSVSTVTASTAAGSIYLNMSNSGTLNAISTGSGTGLIDIAATSGTNLSLNGNMTTSLATISLAGSGSLVQSGATSMTATTLSLLAGTGNIGATGAGRINTAVTSLYATTGTGSNVWISQAGALSVLGTTALGGDYNIASNNSIRLLGNTSIGGNLIWSSSAGPINMDNGSALSVSAQNITLSATATVGNGITIGNAATTLTVRGAGAASTLNFDDDAGTVGIPTLAAGTAVFAGSAGTISINGDLSNAGTLEAIATSGTININYANGALDLNNTTLNTGGTGSAGIILTNDTSGAGNNGTLLDGPSNNTGGVINLTTTGTFSSVTLAAGTNVSFTAGTLNFNTTNNTSLRGRFSNNISLTGQTNGSGSDGQLSLFNTLANTTINIANLTLQPGAIFTHIDNSNSNTNGNASIVFTGNATLGRYNLITAPTISVASGVLVQFPTIVDSRVTFGANAFSLSGQISMNSVSAANNVRINGSYINTVQVGNTVDTPDSSGTMVISAAELARISTPNLYIEDNGNSAINISQMGDLDVSGTGYGKYNLFINTSFADNQNFTTNGYNITLGNKNLSSSIRGNVLLGTVTATTGSIALSTTNNGNITLSNNISTGSNITIAANGSGTVSQTSGTLTATSLRVTSGMGAIVSGGTLQTAVETLSLSTGSTNAIAFNNTGTMTLSASSIGGVLTGVNNTHMTLAGTNTTNGMNLSLTGANSTLGIAASATLSSGANVTLTADHVSINTTSGSINVGSNTLILNPTTTTQVLNLLGASTSDSAGTLDLNAGEFGRISAGTLSIGSGTNTGGISIIGSADLSASGPSHFVLNTGGNYVGTGQTITLGTKTYTVTTGGFLNSGSLTGGATTIALNSAGTMNINGNVSVTGTGHVNLVSTTNAGNITLGGNVGGGAITSISGFGTSNILYGSGSIVGTSASLSSGTGNIGATGAGRIQLSVSTVTASTAAGSIYLNMSNSGTLNAISTGSGTGLIDITATTNTNLSLNGNMTTSLAAISLAGTGSLIQQNPASSITASTAVSLNAVNGSLGSNTQGILINTPTLNLATTNQVYILGQSNMSVSGISVSGNISISNAGNLGILGNLSSGGDLTLLSDGQLNLDPTGIRTHQANNITLAASTVSGSGVRISNAGTTLTANGSGAGSTLNYTDGMITSGATINAGSTGYITLNGDLSNAGTLRTLGSNGVINIHYSSSNLNLDNVVLNVGGNSGSSIVITNDTSGTGNNGTISANAGGGGGLINITTSGGYTVSGNNLSLTASTLSLATTGSVNLAGYWNDGLSVVGTASGGAVSLSNTNTMGTLQLGNLTLTQNTTHRLAANHVLRVNGTVSSAGSLTLLGQSQLTIGGTVLANGLMRLQGDQLRFHAGTVNVGTGTLELLPDTGSQPIHIGASTPDNDTVSLLDISQAELNNITAGTVSIGSSIMTGSISLTGNTNVSSSTFDQLRIRTLGNYSGGSHTLTLGSKSLDVSVGGNLETGNISGEMALSSAGNMTISGNLTHTGNLPLSVGGNLIQATGSITATTLTLQSASNSAMGSLANPILTNVSHLIVSTPTTQSMYFSNTGDLETGSNISAAQTLQISTSGDLTLSHSLSGNLVNLSVNGVLSQNALFTGTALNAVNGVNLSVGQYIGSPSSPVNVGVTSGLLNLTVLGNNAGAYSGYMNGFIGLNSGIPTFLNTLSALFYWNNVGYPISNRALQSISFLGMDDVANFYKGQIENRVIIVQSLAKENIKLSPRILNSAVTTNSDTGEVIIIISQDKIQTDNFDANEVFFQSLETEKKLKRSIIPTENKKSSAQPTATKKISTLF